MTGKVFFFFQYRMFVLFKLTFYRLKLNLLVKGRRLRQRKDSEKGSRRESWANSNDDDDGESATSYIAIKQKVKLHSFFCALGVGLLSSPGVVVVLLALSPGVKVFTATT